MMAKTRKKPEHYYSGNPDLRRRMNAPAPQLEEIQQRLRSLLTPAMFAPLRMKMKTMGFRERLLTLPVMTALVLGLIYRQLPSLSELLRTLRLEGMLELRPQKISKQAFSKRLQVVPASLFADLFGEVLKKLRKRPAPQACLRTWQKRLMGRFEAVWIADGSTLEALRKRLGMAEDSCASLGGKMMMIVGAFTARPVQAFYEQKALTNDKQFTDLLLEALPVGALMVFDQGFFSFPFFDRFTDEKKYFLTRLRKKTAYKSIRVLAEGPRYRDEIIEMGLYRSHPCEHPVRLISVRWGQKWYRYLTNVLDPRKLPAQEAVALYRSRWRIEDAFLLTKRLLGLAYLWVGGSNGVQIQMYATWIFYAVLVDVRGELAEALGKPSDLDGDDVSRVLSCEPRP